MQDCSKQPAATSQYAMTAVGSKRRLDPQPERNLTIVALSRTVVTSGPISRRRQRRENDLTFDDRP